MNRALICFWAILGTCLLFLPFPLHAGESPAGITIISIYDNYQSNQNLESAWGFACVIKMPGGTILFDTGGNAEILLANMEKMQIQPESIDKVVISHIHQDHLGGLKGFLERNHSVTVFIPSSFPDAAGEMIRRKGAAFVPVSEGKKISDSVYTTGELPGPPAEQSLVIDTEKGLIVITGCAHPGIVDVIARAQTLTAKSRIYLVMGGFHHPPLSVVQKFRKIGVEKVAPSHCTGDAVRNAFAREYGDNFIASGAGLIIRP